MSSAEKLEVASARPNTLPPGCEKLIRLVPGRAPNVGAMALSGPPVGSLMVPTPVATTASGERRCSTVPGETWPIDPPPEENAAQFTPDW